MDANVIFIIIDALRTDVLSCYGYQESTSPNIDYLAKKGVLFENAYSCTNVTAPSLTTILSGKYPLSHGIINHGEKITQEDIKRYKSSGTLLLAEILKTKGYVTSAVVGYVSSPVDRIGKVHRRGFDFHSDTLKTTKRKLPGVSLISSMMRKKSSRKLPYEDAERVTDLAIQQINRNHQRKFFLTIHYWDTHLPYRPPKEFVNRFMKKDFSDLDIETVLERVPNNERKAFLSNAIHDSKSANEVIASYVGAISFVDSQIRRLIDTLNDKGIFDKTLVVVTSDHGESLIEHEIYFDHHGLYDVSIHVPLIFVFPAALFQNKRINSFVQHVEIMPTILDLLNLKPGTLNLDGKSLLPIIRGEANEIRSAVYVQESYTERKMAIRTGDYKYIQALSAEDAMCRYCGRIHGGIKELYNLKKDPREIYNIADMETVIANELSKLLQRWKLSFKTRTEKERARLRIKRLKRTRKI